MPTLKLTKKYSTYPEYKNSGVEWLGKIPQSWDVASSRRLFATAKERVGVNFGDYKILSLTLNGVIPRVLDGSGKNPAEYDTYQAFKKNDLVFCLFDYDVTPRTIGHVEEDGMMTGAYTRLMPKTDTHSKYFYYYFLSLDYTKELLHLCTGLRNSLSKPVFWSMNNPLPDIKTQKQIADYLDQKTALIDQTIEKKLRQIELLREKRTAVINSMILNNDGEKVKIKHHVSVNPTKKNVSHTVDDEIVSFVPMEALSESGELTLQERLYKEVKEGFTYFGDGDVVLAKITPCYENGKAGVMKGLKNGFGFGTTEFMVLRPDNKLLSEYLYFVIFSDKFRKMGEVEMRGTAGQKRVTATFVKSYEFNLPGLDIQRGVIKDISNNIECIALAIQKIEKSIELLKEFKSSLISHVVTGKIKI